MSQALSMSAVVRAAGTTRDAVNKWMVRGLLRTPVAETAPGVARGFTRQNALEIAFLSALLKKGMSSELAGGFVQRFLQEEAAGTLKAFFRWEETRGHYVTYNDPTEALAELERPEVSEEDREAITAMVSPDSPPVFDFAHIHLAGIVARVDAALDVRSNEPLGNAIAHEYQRGAQPLAKGRRK